MSWRKQTTVLAGKARELVIRRKGKMVAVDQIHRTANVVAVFTSRFEVLDGGRA